MRSLMRVLSIDGPCTQPLHSREPLNSRRATAARLLMKQFVGRAMRAFARLAASRRIAGEAVVLRDASGTYYAIPIEVFVAGSSSVEARTGIDRRSLELRGIAGDDLHF